MSGGYLTVLDRAGREAKQYHLGSGLVTLGSSSSCDIRFMLSTVEPHHATLVVHNKQTVVHNVGCGETLVNGASVSVAPLAHDDVLTVGGRELRWRYASSEPHRARAASLTPALLRLSRVRARVAARRSLAPAARPPRSPHRSSTPGGARQVAVVQPQRRDAADGSGKSKSPKNQQINLQNTTKASMWIESRKTSPRREARGSPGRRARAVTPKTASSVNKRTPLRLVVLRRAQGAHRTRVTKIEAPLAIDHTKQAAIMLMTGHTPNKRPSVKVANAKTPSLVVKKQGVVTSARRPGRPRKHAPQESTASAISAAPRHLSRDGAESFLGQIPMEAATDATSRELLSNSNISTYSVTDTSVRSPPLPSPKKSALKDSSVKRSTRKTESIKFDLSNLEDGASSSRDTVTASDAALESRDEPALRYSDSSAGECPSPRRSVQSRSGRILEKTLGAPFTEHQELKASSPPPPLTKTPKKSTRGRVMVHKVLQTPDKSHCHQSTVSASDRSSPGDATALPAHETRTSSPRSCSRPDNREAYSVIDLVSMESSSSRSVYSSASDASTSRFATPHSSARRSVRSLRAHCLLASSTPAVATSPRSRSPSASHTYDSFQSSSCQIISRRSKFSVNSPLNIERLDTFNASGRGTWRSPPDAQNIPQLTLNDTRMTQNRNTPPDHGKENVTRDRDMTQSFSAPGSSGDTYNISGRSRRTNSFTTLRDTSRNVTLNGTSSSRISKSSRARVNDDELYSAVVASSPIRSERSPKSSAALTPPPAGMATPENRKSPEEVATPVLSIRSLLDSGRKSSMARPPRRARRTYALGRRAVGKSKSFTFGAAVSTLTGSSNNVARSAHTELNDGAMTPKKSIKLVYEAVKNKHSTAKRPKSIRSVIDHLNDSDIVKQLFNSPVKRKLSQSMIEYSRRRLMEDAAGSPPTKRAATRNTVALTGVTWSDTSPERSLAITPDVFVSPLAAAGGDSRDITSKLRQWRDRMSEGNDVHDATLGTRATRTPRPPHRKSVRNDLTTVSGIKSLFARSPRNRLTDVKIKKLYAASPRNDLTRIPKLRLLFQESPENDLRDVSGVRELFKQRRCDDDVSEVNDFNNVSGIEELFQEQHPSSEPSDANAETSFDLLMGRRPVRAYPKAKSFTTKLIRKSKHCQTGKAQSLHNCFNLIRDNVEEWLETELRQRLRRQSPRQSAAHSELRHNLNKSKTESSVSRELLKLATNTVAGGTPLLASRVRNSTLIKTSSNDAAELKRSASEIYGAHTLPIKKRSLAEASRSRGAHKSSLPIKKRTVKHSTPMKVSHGGAGDGPANVSDMGCISPIAAPAVPADLDADTARPMERGRQKPRPVKPRHVNTVVTADDNIVSKMMSTSKQLSPGNKGKLDSPVGVRSRRNRNVATRRPSVVITRKLPSLSPKPSRKHSVTTKKTKPEPKTDRRQKLDRELQVDLTTKNTARVIKGQKIDIENFENQRRTNKKKKVGRNAQVVSIERALRQPKESPPKTRATRKRKTSAEKVQTPRTLSKTKVLKLTVVVTKPSLNSATRTAKRNKINKSAESPKKSLQRSRKTKAALDETDKSVPPRETANGAGDESKGRGGRGATRRAKSNKGDIDNDPMPGTGRRTVSQRNMRDDNKLPKATEVRTRSTRNTVSGNGHITRTTRSKTAVAQEPVEPAKRRATVKQNSEGTLPGNERKRTGKATIAASDGQDTNKSNRGRKSRLESVGTGRRVTRGRQMKRNDVSVTAAVPRARVTRGGRNNKIIDEESGKTAAEPEAPRRRYTRRRADAGEPSGTGDDVGSERNSKEAARRRVAANTAQTTVAGRKRKADADPSAARASPPKTRRAAAAAIAIAGRNPPRARAAAQAAARTRRR